ncbi:unnamed protein product [Vitrella brassicaformis CCMP3155]|uniref:F-box domain-containing protein n=1 Tax=Vitrella brassicaformis (strain CCMP3155) TaxID=1169540 RepID=A0A0G4EBW6_VITBC|nr:unnamed protein product [Vitrella brassicaformis CCMP3155]|mmetsp:Transcript_15481/g.44238  ORF Transcript_15481/g.44238 Transcript_15481/m.44238 type:complete len:367 (-) Transcript_15481:731-1831(-)|eukprot:CEL93477.1 unnamed protein product [Vitrella brassicaformis CCMP3155]
MEPNKRQRSAIAAASASAEDVETDILPYQVATELFPEVLQFLTLRCRCSLGLVCRRYRDSAKEGTAATINEKLREKHIADVISVADCNDQVGHGTGFGALVRLDWMIENGGSWEATAPLLRLAHHYDRIPALPLSLTTADVMNAQDKTLYRSRPEALRQFSVFSRRVLDDMGRSMTDLRRDPITQRDRIAGLELAVFTDTHTGPNNVPPPPHLLPPNHPFRDNFDANDPACRLNGRSAGSFRSLMIEHMIDARVHKAIEKKPRKREDRNRYDKVIELMKRDAPIFGCKTIDTLGPSARYVILSGDKAGDEFAAHLYIKGGQVAATISLWTTEQPQGNKKMKVGERFPRTVQLVREKMGAEVSVIGL